MKFNTQVCTTKEQSERLLALGLKKETADMTLFLAAGYEVMALVGQTTVNCENIRIGVVEIHKEQISYLPAWSLHRLMNLCPELISHSYTGHEMCLSVTIGGAFYEDSFTYPEEDIEEFDMNSNLYENIIDCIGWLIEGKYFNKEYLEESK